MQYKIITIIKIIFLLKIISFLTGCGHLAGEFHERGSTFANRSDPFFGKHLCNHEKYRCIRVHYGDTWEKLFKDPKERKLVMSLNRTNMALKYRDWLIVPKNLEEMDDHKKHSPFPHQIRAGRKKIVVNIAKQAFAAYNSNGQLLRWGAANTGKQDGEHNTPRGRFAIYRKQGAGCTSSKYPIPTGGSPMPYCMHFYKGYAIHAYQLPGFPISHGCIRVSEKNAEWLNKKFASIGTRVEIY